MVRWMCGVSLRNRCSMAELRERLGIQDVLEVAKIGRLKWFGHLERKEESAGSLGVDFLKLRVKEEEVGLRRLGMRLLAMT